LCTYLEGIVGSLEELLDVWDDAEGVVRRRITLHWLSLFVQEELSEVPLDVFATHESRKVVLEPHIQRMGVRSVDIDLAEHREIRTVLGCKPFDVLLASRFLFPELVARKGQNFEALRLVRVVQGDELLVVLVGQASFGRDVDHQRHLSDELGEVPGLPVDVHGGEVAQGRGRHGGRDGCRSSRETCSTSEGRCQTFRRAAQRHGSEQNAHAVATRRTVVVTCTRPR